MFRTKLGKLECLTKKDLHDLADGLAPGAPDQLHAIETCVAFVLAESKGHWHGRARALMCRRLKHCPLSPEQRRQLVTCITGRLASGNFSEQFRDQLRLALYLDPEHVLAVADQCRTAEKEYVRRLAAWAAVRKSGASYNCGSLSK